jgi:hypothetical protein
MCTVSWFYTADGYELVMNRDELRRRQQALPPRRFERDAVAFLSPEDGDAEGTWIAANELGLTVALLNRYPARDGVFVSRGLLCKQLATSPTVEDATRRLMERGHAALNVRPFTLLLLAPETEPEVLIWDGEMLSQVAEAVEPPLASSARDSQEVGPVRRWLWREIVGEAPEMSAVLDFHRSHRPERGSHSPCMHRDDARTVSLTAVRVTPSAVSMTYADGPPCSTELSHPLTLMRRVATPSPLPQHATTFG